jgi:hypothetical protein
VHQKWADCSSYAHITMAKTVIKNNATDQTADMHSPQQKGPRYDS